MMSINVFPTVISAALHAAVIWTTDLHLLHQM